MAAGAVGDEALGDGRLRVTLLGPFDIKLGDRSVGRWYRPPAKRLCELVLASPGLRVGREVARDLLFAELEPAASATAISRALSLAREALSALGEDVAGRLRSDRAHIWFSTDALVDIDLVDHEKALRSALAMEPGGPRDAALSIALAEDGVLLEDEPYADWAVRPREALELLRQRARLSPPGTEPGVAGAQRERLLSRLGRPVWRTMPHPKRRPLHSCGSIQPGANIRRFL